MAEDFIFISHADETSAMNIVQELERVGVRCWIAPRDPRPGKPFDDEIADAVAGSRFLLLILTAKCNESAWVRRELNAAESDKKDIVTLRLEDIQPTKGLAVRIADRHWLNGFQNRPAAVAEIVKMFFEGRRPLAPVVSTTSRYDHVWPIAAAIVTLLVLGAFGYAYYRELTSADLCGTGPRRTDRSIISTEPTREMTTYLEGLKSGRYSFNWSIDGYEAATQLRFSRRFAYAYNELLEEVKSWPVKSIDEVTRYFGTIVTEERSVDDAATGRDPRLAAVIYLRSYQSSECGFPVVRNAEPSGQAAFKQVAAAYPAFGGELLGSRNLTTFSAIYGRAISIANDEANRAGSVSLHQIGRGLRRAILEHRN
jgi:hypothetical protein